MKKELWHFNNWVSFNNKIYGNTLSQNNFVGDGNIHHQEFFHQVDGDRTRKWAPENSEDNNYVKLCQGNTYYICPKRYVDKFPIQPTEWENVRLKPSETSVWRFITNAKSLNIPEKMGFTYRETIDNWNPVIHEQPKDWTFLKILFSCKDIKLGICAEPGNGKNANGTLLNSILGRYVTITQPPTRAKHYRDIYYNDFIVLNEVTSWSKSLVTELEDMWAEMADDSPQMTKFSCDNNRLLETMQINGKSIIFTFNPISINNPEPFDSKFGNFDKIEDRYPIFLLSGKINDNILRPPSMKADMNVEENFKEMCTIVANIAYWRNNVYSHLNGWDRSKLKLTRRHLNNINDLLIRLDVYSKTQKEFDEWMLFLNNKYKAYKDARRGVIL